VEAGVSVTEVLMDTAEAFGVRLTRHQADKLATAALTHAEGELGHQQVAYREMWENPKYRKWVREKMALDITMAVVAKELLMVTLPAETVTYHMTMFSQASEPVPESAPWNEVHVKLRVKVRPARGTTT
jgi:hypothetical protein